MKSIKFSKAANEHKHAIAELLYSDDKAFVPLTPMLGFDASEFYYATGSDGSDDIRACSSYQLWLEGLDTPDFDETLKIPVYELSSSLVRSPLGGFGAYGPSLQELFMFIRILAIAGYLDKDDPLSGVCVLSAVVSKNDRSLAAMGRVCAVEMEATDFPRWMLYEHRTWFPKYSEADRVIDEEARYFCFTGPTLKTFLERIALFLDNKAPLIRDGQDGGKKEQYLVAFDIPEIRNILPDNGSYVDLVRNIATSNCVPPPKYAALGECAF